MTQFIARYRRLARDQEVCVYRIAIDVGETCSSFVADLQQGGAAFVRVPSIAVEPISSIASGLSSLAKELQLTFEDLLNQTASIVVSPLAESKSLQRFLLDAGYLGEVLRMHSDGSVVNAMDCKKYEVNKISAGAAGGVVGAQIAARSAGAETLISFEMGETRTHLAVIAQGALPLTYNTTAYGEQTASPVIEVLTLEVGANAAAYLDSGGILRVGTSHLSTGLSAGADAQAGPALSDAGIVLGIQNSNSLVTEASDEERKTARERVGGLAAALGVGLEEAAKGMLQVVQTRIAEAIHLMAVRQGTDLKQSVLFAFGTAAGLHATAVARALAIKRVLFPLPAAVYSAWGMSQSGLRHEVVEPVAASLTDDMEEELCGLYLALEGEARQALTQKFDGSVEVEFAADMHFSGQNALIRVPFDAADLRATGFIEHLERKFRQCYAKRYTCNIDNEEVIVAQARVAAIGKLPEPTEVLPLGVMEQDLAKRRRVFLDGEWRELDLHGADQLASDQHLQGPALIALPGARLLLGNNDRSRRAAWGVCDIDVR